MHGTVLDNFLYLKFEKCGKLQNYELKLNLHNFLIRPNPIRENLEWNCRKVIVNLRDGMFLFFLWKMVWNGFSFVYLLVRYMLHSITTLLGGLSSTRLCLVWLPIMIIYTRLHLMFDFLTYWEKKVEKKI